MQLYDFEMEAEQIMQASLDDLLSQKSVRVPEIQNLRLIKIDVEGMEKQVGVWRIGQGFFTTMSWHLTKWYKKSWHDIEDGYIVLLMHFFILQVIMGAQRAIMHFKPIIWTENVDYFEKQVRIIDNGFCEHDFFLYW